MGDIDLEAIGNAVNATVRIAIGSTAPGIDRVRS